MTQGLQQHLQPSKQLRHQQLQTKGQDQQLHLQKLQLKEKLHHQQQQQQTKGKHQHQHRHLERRRLNQKVQGGLLPDRSALRRKSIQIPGRPSRAGMSDQSDAGALSSFTYI
mmetsp:Transcript_21490/g.59501  ORF Transcript_21490/g.59501 Transcript_21490/m.59501 type:complete len:112 (+) Transcript_21490:1298-1633(+)